MAGISTPTNQVANNNLLCNIKIQNILFFAKLIQSGHEDSLHHQLGTKQRGTINYLIY